MQETSFMLGTTLFWVITQRVTVISYGVSGQPMGPILRVQETKKKPEDGTDRLSRNIGKRLPLLAEK
jgi:hypothetical protein